MPARLARQADYPPELSKLVGVDGHPFEVLRYGPAADQFGEFWPGTQAARTPVVVLLHGGYWRNKYRLDVMHALSAELQRTGVAVWNLEFRRVGSPGGGWPGTFTDVAAGLDVLVDLAQRHPIDLARVAVLGHSAGGHLALWTAARHRLTTGWSGASPRLVPALAVSVAGVCDLVAAAGQKLSDGAVIDLLGGYPATLAEVYRKACAKQLLPLGVAQLIVHGTEDTSTPYDMSAEFAAAAVASGDDCEFLGLPGVDHFSVIDPTTSPGSTIIARVLDRLRSVGVS